MNTLLEFKPLLKKSAIKLILIPLLLSLASCTGNEPKKDAPYWDLEHGSHHSQ